MIGRPHIDLTGQKHGLMTVLDYAGGARWKCKCECGKVWTVGGESIRRGTTKSCGCVIGRSPKNEQQVVERRDALLITPSEAIARGMKLYFTGVPCKHGHVSPRRVSDRYCCECDRRKITPEVRGQQSREVVGREIHEFNFQWPDDGGARVELVVDPNWLIDGKPRVVRKVAWRPCMCCKTRFFSQDITRIRMCDACKTGITDVSDRQALPRGDRHWRKRRSVHPAQDAGSA